MRIEWMAQVDGEPAPDLNLTIQIYEALPEKYSHDFRSSIFVRTFASEWEGARYEMVKAFRKRVLGVV